MKKLLLLCGTVFTSLSLMAQDASSSAIDLGEYMSNLEGAARSQVESILPSLGNIAVVGLGLFIALWAFRALKRFMGR